MRRCFQDSEIEILLMPNNSETYWLRTRFSPHFNLVVERFQNQAWNSTWYVAKLYGGQHMPTRGHWKFLSCKVGSKPARWVTFLKGLAAISELLANATIEFRRNQSSEHVQQTHANTSGGNVTERDVIPNPFCSYGSLANPVYATNFEIKRKIKSAHYIRLDKHNWRVCCGSPQ